MLHLGTCIRGFTHPVNDEEAYITEINMDIRHDIAEMPRYTRSFDPSHQQTSLHRLTRTTERFYAVVQTPTLTLLTPNHYKRSIISVNSDPQEGCLRAAGRRPQAQKTRPISVQLFRGLPEGLSALWLRLRGSGIRFGEGNEKLQRCSFALCA